MFTQKLGKNECETFSRKKPSLVIKNNEIQGNQIRSLCKER